MFQRVRHHVSNRRKSGLLTTLFTVPVLLLSLSAAPAYADLVIDPTTATISNSPSSASNLNAQDIADNLVFTSITVQATASITVTEPVDMSSSTFGTPHFNLTLEAPTCNIDANVIMSTQGHLFLTCTTINLNGTVIAGGSLINPTRVTSTAPLVNVLSPSASIQQAINFSTLSSTPVIQVGPGNYTENLVINQPITLTGNDGTNPIGADPNAPTINGALAGGNVITVNANNVEIDGLHLNGAVASAASSVSGIVANNVDSLTIAHNTLDGFFGLPINTGASTNVTLTANAPANQIVAFTSSAPTAVVGGSPYTPTASATSNMPVAITVDSAAASVCAINSGSVSFLTAGTCVLDANQAGGNGYNPAPQVQQSFGVNLASQTVSFSSSAPVAATVGGATYSPAASSTSGLPVAITVDSAAASVCAINSGSVSFQAAGTCTLDANQGGNASYAAATQVQQSITVGQASQTVSFSSSAPGIATVGGPTYTPTASATSGLPAAITVDATAASVCSMSSGVVSFLSSGSCILDANQGGNANYSAAAQAQQTFTVSKASQTISFSTTAPNNAVVGGQTYAPAASATSGLPVAITVDTASAAVCSISGGAVSFQAVGTCKLDANQSGNASYTAAAQVQQAFTVSSPTPTWSGFEQPINADGSSIFKLGRTVPVKFQLTGASAGITNLQARLYVTKITNNVLGTDTEAISTSAADSGNTFRYDPTSQSYIFNLGTSNLTAGTYQLKIYVNGDNTTGTLLGTVNVSVSK